MSEFKVGIELYSALIHEWHNLSLVEKARRLEATKANTPQEAIINIQYVVADLVDRLAHVSSEDQDIKTLTYTDLSKTLDPATGFIIPRLRDLIEVTQIKKYDEFQIAFIKTYSSFLFQILEQLLTKSARNHIHQASLMWQADLLPMCEASPKNFKSITQKLDERLDLISYILQNTAQSIRRFAAGPDPIVCKELLGQIMAMIAQRCESKSKSEKEVDVADAAERSAPLPLPTRLSKGCTVEDLDSNGISKFATGRTFYLRLLDYKKKSRKVSVRITQVDRQDPRKGTYYNINGEFKYRIKPPKAIAFIDQLIDAKKKAGKEADSYVFVPFTLSSQGAKKRDFHPTYFKSKAGKRDRTPKEAEFWKHFIISQKQETHKPKGKPVEMQQCVRLGISKAFDAFWSQNNTANFSK